MRFSNIVGEGFVPANLYPDSVDGVITVNVEGAAICAVRLAREEAIFAGTAAAAALAAVAGKVPEIPDDSVVLTFSHDTGGRHFSVEGPFDADGDSARTTAQAGSRVTRAAA